MPSFAEFHEQQFREGTMRIVFNMVLVSIALFAGNTALAQQQLPPVEVTASTLSGAGPSVIIPFSLIKDMRATKNTNVAILGDYVTPLDQAQVCSNLKANQPSGCTTSNYAAVPGINSASNAVWKGNGCGADPWSSAAGTAYLEAMLPGVFSGDLNRPVQGNRSIDFTAYCNDHDRGYTSLMPKQTVDNRFSTNLHNFCNQSTSSQLCNGFASTYVEAVSKYGDAAYAEDQADLACAAWGSSMKANKCGS